MHRSTLEHGQPYELRPVVTWEDPWAGQYCLPSSSGQAVEGIEERPTSNLCCNRAHRPAKRDERQTEKEKP